MTVFVCTNPNVGVSERVYVLFGGKVHTGFLCACLCDCVFGYKRFSYI